MKLPAARPSSSPDQGRLRWCKTHGKYTETVWGRRAFGCPQCREMKQKQAEKADEAARTTARMDALWAASGVPGRYRRKRLDTFLIDAPLAADREKQEIARRIAETYVDNWHLVRQNGKCLIFLGRPGTGKTHLAIGIARALLERHGCRVCYVSLLDVIERIKDVWNGRSEEGVGDVISPLTKADLLIVDETSLRHGTQNEQLQFFRIINKRYENVLPTILISNAGARETERLLGAAAWDRLREGQGQAVIFDWPSHRGRSDASLQNGACSDTKRQTSEQASKRGT